MPTVRPLLAAACVASLLGACGGTGDDDDALPARFSGSADRMGEAQVGECIQADPWAFLVVGADVGAPTITSLDGARGAPDACEAPVLNDGMWSWSCTRTPDVGNPSSFDFEIAADLSGGTMRNLMIAGDQGQFRCEHVFAISALTVED